MHLSTFSVPELMQPLVTSVINNCLCCCRDELGAISKSYLLNQRRRRRKVILLQNYEREEIYRAAGVFPLLFRQESSYSGTNNTFLNEIKWKLKFNTRICMHTSIHALTRTRKHINYANMEYTSSARDVVKVLCSVYVYACTGVCAYAYAWLFTN